MVSRMSWEDHHRLCEEGTFEELVNYIDSERDPLERDCLYIGTVNMCFDCRSNRTELAMAIGTRYLHEFYEREAPFGVGRKPDARVLKRMALMFERSARFEMGVWACDVALAFGITDDETKGGFKARRDKLKSATNGG